MEPSCWSPENCQVVPSFDNHITLPFPMDPMNQDIDYGMQQQYCSDFEGFNVNFEEVFNSFVEKSKDDLSTIDGIQVQPMITSTPVDRPIMVKTENADMMFNTSCNMPPNQTPSRPNSLTIDTVANCDYNSPPPMFSMTGPEEGIELYHDLIMRHLIQDIQATCNRLNISSDPRCWSAQDTQTWLVDMAHQYHLANLPFDQLTLPGQSLCSLGLEALKQAYQAGGELVHAQLNLWTTASDYSMRHQNIQQSAHLPLRMNSEDSSASAWSPTAYTNAAIQSHVYPQLIRYPKVDTKCMKRSSLMPIASPQGFGTFLPSPSSDSGISTDLDEFTDCDTLSPLNSPHAPAPTNNIHLWQFLRELLDNQEKYAHCVRWIDRTQGIFKIEDSHKLAKLWGQRKNRPAMNYDKLSRSLRQYYRKSILKKTPRSQRLVYQFLPPYHIC